MPMICPASTSLFVRPISCSEADVSPDTNNHLITIYFRTIEFLSRNQCSVNKGLATRTPCKDLYGEDFSFSILRIFTTTSTAIGPGIG